jgi:hypothetical protein
MMKLVALLLLAALTGCGTTSSFVVTSNPEVVYIERPFIYGSMHDAVWYPRYRYMTPYYAYPQPYIYHRIQPPRKSNARH